MKALLTPWGEYDPDGAYEWIKELPDEDSKLSVMPEVVGHLLLTNKEKATSWLDSQELNEALDRSLGPYHHRLLNSISRLRTY